MNPLLGELMNRIKQVLVEKHIGAILIALFLNRSISFAFETITIPISNRMLAATWQTMGQPPNLSPYQVVMNLAGVILYGGAAALLLKWLYFPSQPKMIDGAEDGDGQEADAQ